MRRILLALLPAVWVACAGKTPPPQDAKGPPGSPPPAADEVVSTYDLTQSGKPNVWKYTRRSPDGKEIVVRRERDLNSDGRIDVWEFNDAEGNPEKQVLDLDFDGKADVIHHFEKGQLVRKEMSFGFDGKPPRTFRELGSQMGVCKERIRQIELTALQKLRQSLSPEEFELLTG